MSSLLAGEGAGWAGTSTSERVRRVSCGPESCVGLTAVVCATATAASKAIRIRIVGRISEGLQRGLLVLHNPCAREKSRESALLVDLTPGITCFWPCRHPQSERSEMKGYVLFSGRTARKDSLIQ